MRAPLIGIVLLAAGQGKRFTESGGGTNKLLSEITDSYGATSGLFEAVLTQAKEAGLPIVVVTRPEYQLIRDLAIRMGARLALCESNGSGESVAAGVALAEHWDGWIISLGDMPWITGGQYLRIKEKLISGADQVRLVYKGIPGHPVGFSDRYRAALLDLKGDEGARSLINSAILIRLDADVAVITDIDEAQ